ncbi:MAG: hydrogen gas-evolving membrane-bound hydrogenase subunit E, partial [Planctomycetota bacterium]
IAALGIIGYSVAMIFGIYGAPDLAMTQFAVETLIVIIFVLVIYALPKFNRLTHTSGRIRDAIVAVIFGTTMSLMTLAAMTAGTNMPVVSIEHAARSVPEAFGRNVVNVILVDFRALDTLGEIFVLGLAAVGVYTLLRLRAGRTTHVDDQIDAADDAASEAFAAGGRSLGDRYSSHLVTPQPSTDPAAVAASTTPDIHNDESESVQESASGGNRVVVTAASTEQREEQR